MNTNDIRRALYTRLSPRLATALSVAMTAYPDALDFNVRRSPCGEYVITPKPSYKPTHSEIVATLEYLKRCRAARAAGYPVAYTTDPAWLLDMAINRRAGWPDDPSLSRGSARPLPDGRYPPKADGDRVRHLRQLSDKINTPRLIVREGELGEHRRLILARIPRRITTREQE